MRRAFFFSAMAFLAQAQSFEVASVKPSPAGSIGVSFNVEPGGRYVVTNATLKMLLVSAYGVRDYQISGGPGWIAADRWNIEAKAPQGSLPPIMGPPDSEHPDPLMKMVQSLLADRFQLKAHLETRETAVYELALAKGGSKLKLSENQTPVQFPDAPTGPVPPRGLMRFNLRGNMAGSSVPVSMLAGLLSEPGLLERRVIDKTGLKGLYDFELKWTPDIAGATPSDEPAQGSLFTALQEQLGLKAQPARGSVEFVVIDGVQKPDEN